jgi:hypothetical protein
VDERGELCKTIYGNFAANLEIYYQDFFHSSSMLQEAGAGGKQERGHILPFKDLEKAEFAAFRQIFFTKLLVIYNSF